MPLGAPANTTAEGQSYVFGDQELERLSRDVGHLSFVNESEVSLDTFQFYVGPQASGAPVHFHGDAVNMLVYGAKQWALLPPPIAQYSKLPAQQWFGDVLPRLVGARPPVVQCVQRAGEAIYVPAVSPPPLCFAFVRRDEQSNRRVHNCSRQGWGHAVLNLRPSVGFASEFEQRDAPVEEGPGQGREEAHQVGWCNSKRWSSHLYTCREL